jgi:hypothetical protein
MNIFNYILYNGKELRCCKKFLKKGGISSAPGGPKFFSHISLNFRGFNNCAHPNINPKKGLCTTQDLFITLPEYPFTPGRGIVRNFELGGSNIMRGYRKFYYTHLILKGGSKIFSTPISIYKMVSEPLRTLFYPKQWWSQKYIDVKISHLEVGQEFMCHTFLILKRGPKKSPHKLQSRRGVQTPPNYITDPPDILTIK